MANKIKGGIDTENVIGNNDSSVKGETVNLSFNTQAELEVFAQIKALAAEDDRTVAKYIVRLLKAKYSTQPSS